MRFNTIYANGSSLTAGGGLGESGVKKVYKDLYGVEWGNQKDVTYPQYVANHFECDLVHDAQSGSGVPRLIRRTYEYIESVGLEQAKKTLFLFEITDPIHRIDMYCNEIQDYMVVNVGYKSDGSYEFVHSMEPTYYEGKKHNPDIFKGKMIDELKSHLEKYHDPIAFTNKFRGDLIGLFSFLNENNIEYFYMFNDSTLKLHYEKLYDDLDKKRNVIIDGFVSINQFCTFQDHNIKAETNNFTDDGHPGYFGHKLYSEKLIKNIEQRLRPKLWVFGDSFTETFKSHFESSNDWSTKYKKFKQGENSSEFTTPKNYSEIIAESLNVDLENYGVGGCSNQTIFDNFIRCAPQIKPNDYVIFQWTEQGRFRISTEANFFRDITGSLTHPPQNDDVSSISTSEIAINRSTYSVYWTEIENYIKIIKMILKNDVYHWTWVRPDERLPNRLWSKRYKMFNLALYVKGDWDEVSQNHKDLIKRETDIIYDVFKNLNTEEIRTNFDSGKKIVLVNVEKLNVSDQEKINQMKLGFEYYHATNYKKSCFNNFIPWKEYSSIYDETNGVVDDMHYSEKGHVDLANDLLIEIKKSLKFPPKKPNSFVK
jgi:hypothetical protein